MTPIILSGGSGTRLWPVSRANYPKQFCGFYDQSFLKTSIERLKGFGNPGLITLDSMRPLTTRLFREMNLSEKHVVYEPIGKNTAAPVALICHLLKLQGKPDEIVGIFPADHLIGRPQVFKDVVQLAEQVAQKGHVVTLGITPRGPETGYGYIEVNSQKISESGELQAFHIAGFREKPTPKVAAEFLASGRHFWNSGMFIFKASVMAEHFQTHMPELWKKISTLKEDLSELKYVYASLESISIDYGIMEKIGSSIACIPCDMGWSDVGSWDEISRIDDEARSLKSDSLATVFKEDAGNNFVFSISPKVVGLVGVNDLLVVDTPDALLISKKGESQKVKDLVQNIKTAGLSQATEHPFETRPWGRFEILSDHNDFKVKKITVDSGEQLSYQSHSKRDEHWVVIQGEATITLDETSHELKAGQHIFIRRGQKHRMSNKGKQPLIFVEVQTGEYFGEDDIVRYQDDYNRR